MDWYIPVAGAVAVAYAAFAVGFMIRRRILAAAWPLVIGSAWLVVSSAYIETGINIAEEGRDSVANGATVVLVALLALFLVGLLLTVRFLNGRFMRRPIAAPLTRSWATFVMLGTSMVLGVLYLNLAGSRIPLLDPSLDRFDYWRESRWPFLHVVLGDTTVVLAFLFGFVWYSVENGGRGRTFRILGAGGFLLYLSYLVLLGHKFSAPLLAILLFFLPRLVGVGGVLRMNARQVTVSALVAAGVLGVVYYHYSRLYNPYASTLGIDASDAILYRALALQGHVWWGTFDAVVAGPASPTLNLGDLLFGMQHLMRLVGGSGVEKSIERGVSFSGGYPAIAVFVFPMWFAVPIQLAVGALYGAAVAYINRAVWMSQPLRAAVMLQVLQWLDYGVGMGSFYKLWNLPVLLALVGLVGLELVEAIGQRRTAIVDNPAAVQ